VAAALIIGFTVSILIVAVFVDPGPAPVLLAPSVAVQLIA